MRNVTLARDWIAVTEILPTAAPFGLAVLVEFDLERIGLGIEFPFHVAAQVEVASMSDPFQLAPLPFIQERKRILDVGGPR